MPSKPPPITAKRGRAETEPGLSYDTLFSGIPAEHALWLRHFLDAENPITFTKAQASAKAAGISPSLGYALRYRLSSRIQWFLNECGLDETSLRAKVFELMHADETKVITVSGVIEAWDLPPHAEIVGIFKRDKPGPDGSLVVEDVTVLSLRMADKELQRKALDMAIKVQGLYAPEKKEVTGKDGEPLYGELTDLERAARLDSLLAIARDRRDRSASD